MSEIATNTDLILFDLKHLDPIKHEQGTGASNERILENLKKLTKMTRNIRIRIPVIPKFNDSEDDMRSMVEFMTLHDLEEVDLLPYHIYAEGKYKILGRKYELVGTEPPTEEQMESFRALLESYGLKATIGG